VKLLYSDVRRVHGVLEAFGIAPDGLYFATSVGGTVEVCGRRAHLVLRPSSCDVGDLNANYSLESRPVSMAVVNVEPQRLLFGY
jgi:hypothetical protein